MRTDITPGGTSPDYELSDHASQEFRNRPSFMDLWHDLRGLCREIRRDWDLSTPGLHEALDAGELSPFHGWDKRPRVRETAA